MSGTIGPRLRAAREAARLSQSELARRAGLRRATVCDLERGGTADGEVRVGTLAALAAALGVGVAGLLGELPPGGGGG